MKQRKQIQVCKVCERHTNDAYLCRRCANDCHDMLVGSREPDGQPGVVWYAKRLREAAWGQTRLGKSAAAKTSNTGYALLGDQRAALLLDRIAGVLALWDAVVVTLRASHSHESASGGMGVPTKDLERLETVRARFVAANITLIRHHCPNADRLHRELLDVAQQAWRIINRPNDVCCGPCPTILTNEGGTEYECATVLYAEEGASSVQCQRCRSIHDVEQLREQMKTQVADMLFTRAELVNLMATRLNDPIKQPLFTKLLRTNKLQPRVIDNGEPMFTYNDVCAARLRDNRRTA